MIAKEDNRTKIMLLIIVIVGVECGVKKTMVASFTETTLSLRNIIITLFAT